MYHRISEETFDPWGLAVCPRLFEGQMNWLAAERTVMPLSEFAHLQRNGELPATATAVTFDDGYAAAVEVAAPILERLGLPATTFVPADLLERQQEFWWDELERVVLTSDCVSLELDGETVALCPKSQQDRDWRFGSQPKTQRQTAFHRLWSCLRLKTPTELDAALKELRDQSGVQPIVRENLRPITSSEARVRSSDLLEWGSHALTHPSLPSLSSEEKRREIVQSVERCTELFGRVPKTFAYPYGDCDLESERLVGEAGFVCACTTENGTVTRSSSVLRLPRVQVGNWEVADLARVLGHE